MERSERPTSDRDTLLASSGRQRVDLALSPSAISHQIGGLKILFGEKLFVMKPDHVEGRPGVILFLHGGVWIVGNFDNHKRLVRDIVVESGQPAVFLQYSSLLEAKYPVQMNQVYAALEVSIRPRPRSRGSMARVR